MRSRPLLAHEQARILRALKRESVATGYKSLIAAALATGLRISELLALTREQITTPRGAVREWVTVPKELMKGSKRSRLVRFPPQIRAAIREHLAVSPKLWPRSRASAWRAVKRAAARAGIPTGHVSPHSFRHTFAIRTYKRLGDLAATQLVLGHISTSTTMLYLGGIRSLWLRL